MPDPRDRFGMGRPATEVFSLVSPAGPTAKRTVTLGTKASGSSLADEENRRLNIGAIAEMREGRLKEIVHQQYSPHGTQFRFLSSEDGRAPDTLSLVSAGIGLCFMTQFGRFASMQALELSAYRIAQDTHFSLGGASGSTGRSGTVASVETHVYPDTSKARRSPRRW